ncbi:MAG: DUF6036 family nucleotidyltransferase [Longimicrobiales bacterium]
MKRTEFEHAVRAAAAVLGVDELLVIGSQALHGSVESDLPEEALRSVEVDVAALEDPEGRKADLIDGAIGEASMFHATFGYYAQGVEAVTAVLPDGWEGRLVRFRTAGTLGVVAWCLEPHDLWISKMVAGRPKDLEFGRALLERRIVEPAELMKRLEDVNVGEPIRRRIAGKIKAWSTG